MSKLEAAHQRVTRAREVERNAAIADNAAVIALYRETQVPTVDMVTTARTARAALTRATVELLEANNALSYELSLIR